VRLQFLGADRQVSGSKHCLEIGGKRILIDCGMYQERQYSGRNWQPCPVHPGKIDAVLLTHAHIDHCGLLPRLVGQGLEAPIFSTAATADLVALMLEDSARIQAEDAAYKRRRHEKEGRRGKHPEVPLFRLEDVERTLPLLRSVPYGHAQKISPQVTATFHDAGHILGSAVVELDVSHNGRGRRILFSGDLGQWGKPIIRDPTVFARADYILMESTYGDRDHDQHGAIEDQLASVVRRTIRAGGNVVIPVFAVERAQELMYYFGRLIREDRIPPVDVFLNSPMAVDVTRVFRRHRECFDDQAWEMIDSGEPPLKFPGLQMIRSVEESKSIHEHHRPAVIMATSGMCTAGRIKHHLRHNITRPESTILFVGYQAHGTLGRRILDGEPEVRIHGRCWPVKARIERLEGCSGHADRKALLYWLDQLEKPPKRLFLVHGEEQASESLAGEVRRRMGWQVCVPRYQEKVDLE